MNKIETIARIIAEIDDKYEAIYDNLPFHRQLSCRAMARRVMAIIKRLEEVDD